jgi:uncharacterized protein YegL
MPERALPPAIVLISDGQPTDDFDGGLDALLGEPWGAHAVRLAVAIGRDVDLGVLDQFIGRTDISPVSANNPEQLVQMIRWASTVAARLASEPMATPDEFVVPVPGAAAPAPDVDDVW